MRRGAKTTGVKMTTTDEDRESEVGGRASAPARNYQTTFQAAPAALARL